ncbi:hypothetical protein [Streptomyces sp. NPDC002276]
MAETAGRVEHLCTLLDDGELYAYAEQAGADSVLRRLLAAVRDGGADTDVKEDLDALDEAMARFGLGAVTQPARAYQPVAGTLQSRRVVQAWACPTGRPCSRVESVAQHAQAPICAISGQRLTLVRVTV